MTWKINLLVNVLVVSVVGDKPFRDLGITYASTDNLEIIIDSEIDSYIGTGSGLGFGTCSNPIKSITSNSVLNNKSNSGYKSIIDSSLDSNIDSFDNPGKGRSKRSTNPFKVRNPRSPRRKREPKRKVRPSPKDFGKVIFSDNFRKFDHNKWQQARTASGGGNWEFQFYNDSRKTSFVKKGKLHIKPMTTSEYLGITDEQIMKKGKIDFITNDPKTNCTDDRFWGCYRETNGDNIINPTVSAQIRSINSFSFKYGKVEIVAKLPKGDWLWPAIWLMPKNEKYGVWPASGEINIVESRGNDDDCYGDGVSTVASVLHWGLDYQTNRYDMTAGKHRLDRGDFSDGFHKFTLEWTPDYIRTWVDKKHLIMDVSFNESLYKLGNFAGNNNPWKGRGNNAPFDQEFYLIFNVAVGGTMGYFPDIRDSEKDQKIYNQCKPKYDNNYKPYKNFAPAGAKNFLSKRNEWEPTWGEGDQSHMIINSVKVTEYIGLSTSSNTRGKN